MSWNLNSERPIYAQIMERITLDIVSGIYPPGARLPSVRDLAQDAGVISQRTNGRFITEDLTMVEKVKQNLASMQIREFLEKMEHIGFTKETIIQLIEQIETEEEAS